MIFNPDSSNSAYVVKNKIIQVEVFDGSRYVVMNEFNDWMKNHSDIKIIDKQVGFYQDNRDGFLVSHITICVWYEIELTLQNSL
jgi:hypothetical protein